MIQSRFTSSDRSALVNQGGCSHGTSGGHGSHVGLKVIILEPVVAEAVKRKVVDVQLVMGPKGSQRN